MINRQLVRNGDFAASQTRRGFPKALLIEELSTEITRKSPVYILSVQCVASQSIRLLFMECIIRLGYCGEEE